MGVARWHPSISTGSKDAKVGVARWQPSLASFDFHGIAQSTKSLVNTQPSTRLGIVACPILEFWPIIVGTSRCEMPTMPLSVASILAIEPSPPLFHVWISAVWCSRLFVLAGASD